MEFSSIEEVLDYAIAREAEAESLYTEMADRVTGPMMREVLLEFAAEERGHGELLQKVRDGELPRRVSIRRGRAALWRRAFGGRPDHRAGDRDRCRHRARR